MEGSHVTSGDGEAEEWSERGDHPLMNDLVAKTVFGFVRRYDLMACRSACKKWNVCTIPRMRTSFNLKISGNQYKRQITRPSEDSVNTIYDFVKLFNSNELGIPFGKFQLGPFCTETEDAVGQRFLQLCGETATEIDLDEGGTDVYTIEDVSEILRCSPNLKVLGCPTHITSRSGNIVKLFPHSIPTLSFLRKITFRSYESERLEFCPTWIEELLTAAPNVSEVVAYDGLGLDDDDEDEGNSYGISFLLNCIEKLGRESFIQSLDLRNTKMRHVDHLKRMTEKENGLKLKSLTLDPTYMTEDDSDTVLIELATILKDSLQHFIWNKGSHNFNWTEFPFMPHLKSLTFKIYNEFDFETTAVNLNDYLPALEKLDIGFEDDDEDWEEYFSVFQFQSCPTIKTLIVEYRAIKF